MLRLGVVSFLNARPLIHGLDRDPRVRCLFDVPAALPGYLERGDVDVALIPVIDLLRSPGHYKVISDACIGCDGETMTVRVFSQVPPDRIETLWVDAASHTSVALVRVLWRELYGRDLQLRTTPVGQSPAELHTLRPPGATPGPAIFRAEYANPGKAARSRASCVWVRLPPRSLTTRSRGPTATTPA